MSFKSETFSLYPVHKNIFYLFDKQTKKLFPGVIVKKYTEKKAFNREWKNLRLLSRVPEVPKVLASQGMYLIITEKPGKELIEILLDGRVFSESEIKDIIKQILNILWKIHRCKVVHRDLKLENIIYDEATGRVSIIDFDQMLTHGYVAPETLKKPNRLRYSHDVWCVGVMCYILLEHRYPFNNEKEVIYSGYSPILNNCSASMKNFIDCCLIKDYHKRPTVLEVSKHAWLQT